MRNKIRHNREHPLLNDLVLRNVIEYLTIHDIFHCRQVCQKWNLKTRELTFNSFRITFQSDKPRKKRRMQQLASKVFNFFLNYKAIQPNSINCNLFDFMEIMMSSTSLRFTNFTFHQFMMDNPIVAKFLDLWGFNIRILTLDCGKRCRSVNKNQTFNLNLVSIFKRCPNLIEFNVFNYAQRELQITNDISINTLKELKLISIRETNASEKAASSFVTLLSSSPHLESLSIPFIVPNLVSKLKSLKLKKLMIYEIDAFKDGVEELNQILVNHSEDLESFKVDYFPSNEQVFNAPDIFVSENVLFPVMPKLKVLHLGFPTRYLNLIVSFPEIYLVDQFPQLEHLVLNGGAYYFRIKAFLHGRQEVHSSLKSIQLPVNCDGEDFFNAGRILAGDTQHLLIHCDHVFDKKEFNFQGDIQTLYSSSEKVISEQLRAKDFNEVMYNVPERSKSYLRLSRVESRV